uniref:pseudouridine 5'-phosphatase n=2 Tax=Macrostomum lignano TaxID=282301 RepID=A0A1I8J2V8_9PLAT
MTTNSSSITHAIFDMDGLLIDTESIYTDCYNKFCAQFGKQFTWEIKQKQMGRPPNESAKIIIDHLDLPITVEQHHEMINTMLLKEFPYSKIMPGVNRLLEHLWQHRVPMCIATGSDQTGFDVKVGGRPELLSKFHHWVLAGSDPAVGRGKPAPDCFLVAADRFDPTPIDPARVLVFEDAPNGVEAALAAGMKVVWCPDPRADTSVHAGNPSVTVLRSLEDFQPETFGLPPFPTGDPSE